MGDDRRNDADQIDIIASDQSAPVILGVFDAKLARNFFGVLTMGAGDRDDAGVFAVLETRNLRRARESRADDADANCLCDCGSLSLRSRGRSADC